MWDLRERRRQAVPRYCIDGEDALNESDRESQLNILTSAIGSDARSDELARVSDGVDVGRLQALH